MENIDFNQKVVEMKDIVKKFGHFVANDHINLTVYRGEVHALLGENGAGKTTLMNILYGLYQATSGEIYINEKKVDITDPNKAIELGIGMVHQHFMLIDPFTVAENIILGSEITKSLGVLDMKAAIEKVEELSKRYGLYVDPHSKIEDITVGMQQRVEILKALYRGADLLILDEPTAVLTPQEIHELMDIIRNLTKEGKTVIIITHKLREIKEAADFCTIIRRGKHIDTVKVEEASEETLASIMVGRSVDFKVEKEDRAPGDKVLEIESITARDNRGILALKDLTLDVYAGEILGIAGVDGNGQSELVEGITGLRRVESGEIRLKGKDITNNTPREIIDQGIASIPEDRQKRGLVLDFTVAENMVLEQYHRAPFAKKGRLSYENIKDYARKLMEQFDVRPRDENLYVKSLSGGNQQKVIIAREFSNHPEVFIASQPTRGLDVGAIEYIHKSLVEERDRNKGILLVSLDLDEIMNLSDRIAVIYEGRIVGILDRENADENTLGVMMAGGDSNNG